MGYNYNNINNSKQYYYPHRDMDVMTALHMAGFSSSSMKHVQVVGSEQQSFTQRPSGSTNTRNSEYNLRLTV